MNDKEKMPNQDSDFMREKIKERPINKRRLLYRTILTAAMAVIFGLIACFTFLVLEPVFSNWLYPEEEPEVIELPDVTEEMLPEDMLVQEPTEEETEDQELEQEQIDKILASIQLDRDDYAAILASMSELAADAGKAMVTVTSVVSNVDWFDNPYESKGQTSGLVVDDNGRDLLLITNKAPIEKAETILVTFADNSQAKASIKQSDANTGLAVLSIPLADISEETRESIVYASWGSSSNRSMVGAPVIAVGSPIGTGGSVCYGMVTSIGNNISLTDANYQLVTTDIYGSQSASGVLINLSGQVVGIINCSYNNSDTKNLISAIGITELRRIIEKMLNGQQFGFLGVNGTDVTKEANEQLEVPYGAYLTGIIMDSPAMNSGLQSGDVITGFDDNIIHSFADLTACLVETPPNTAVQLTIERQGPNGYQEIEIEIELGASS